MKVDEHLASLFAADGVPTLADARPDGYSLRARFVGGDGEVTLVLLPPGSVRARCAGTRAFDVVHPGGEMREEDRRLLERVIEVLERDRIRTTRRDWVESLGEHAIERFLAGSIAEVKITASCDQKCVFCKSPPDLPNHASVEETRSALPLLARRASFLTLSGGEPTASRHLVEIIRLAREAGFESVEVQTNGMRASDQRLAERIAAAGATHALVSLHAHEEEISDRLTHTPGGYRRTLRGIDNLVRVGLRVSLCHVICEGNYRHLPDFAEFIILRFNTRPMRVVFTLAVPTYRVREVPGLMPRISALGPGLRFALSRFAPADGRTGSRHVASVIAGCGLPPCSLGNMAPYHEELIGSCSTASRGEMVHPDLCDPCVHRGRCSGLWREYVDRYGTDGIAPVSGSR
jgi:pyruvate-formate lyase-activating enzyme